MLTPKPFYLNLKVSATVLIQKWRTDIVYLQTELPSTMPNVTNNKCIFQFECKQGSGIDYLKSNFNVEEIKVIEPDAEKKEYIIKV